MASSSTSKYPVLPSTKAPRVVRKRVGGGYKYVLDMTEGKDAHDKEKELDRGMEKADEEVRGEVSIVCQFCIWRKQNINMVPIALSILFFIPYPKHFWPFSVLKFKRGTF